MSCFRDSKNLGAGKSTITSNQTAFDCSRQSCSEPFFGRKMSAKKVLSSCRNACRIPALLWLVELLSYDEAVAQQKEQEEFELEKGSYGSSASMDEDGENANSDDIASEKAFYN